MTTLELYNELKSEIPLLPENKQIKNNEIMLLEPQIVMLKKLFSSWAKKSIPIENITALMTDVFKNPNTENGKVYEALLYAWLEIHHIRYTPQIHINQEDCFKLSAQGYDADGVIKENNIVFDIKQFGLTLSHIETLRKKIQSKIPKDYFLTIEGGRNISTRDLQTNFLEKTDELASCIMNEKMKNYTDYLYHDPKFGLEFRAWNRKESSIFTSFSEFNSYEWAESNESHFLYHASQFCLNSPYILFCPYDECLIHLFSNDTNEDMDFTFLTFRALCRRIFMKLTKMEDRKINEFDTKARNDISVATATRKISAIVFVDVSKEFEYKICRTFVFQNPNADNKIPSYQIDSLFRYIGATIEDFRFDNY